MARTLDKSELKTSTTIKFKSTIRGHIWSSYKSEKLAADPNGREEALEYDKYAIVIYKEKDDDCGELVGHASAKISCLLYHFLRASDCKVEILRQRKHEVGLLCKQSTMTLGQNDKLLRF